MFLDAPVLIWDAPLDVTLILRLRFYDVAKFLHFCGCRVTTYPKPRPGDTLHGLGWSVVPCTTLKFQP